jgi:hypothetical protein
MRSFPRQSHVRSASGPNRSACLQRRCRVGSRRFDGADTEESGKGRVAARRVRACFTAIFSVGGLICDKTRVAFLVIRLTMYTCCVDLLTPGSQISCAGLAINAKVVVIPGARLGVSARAMVVVPAGGKYQYLRCSMRRPFQIQGSLAWQSGVALRAVRSDVARHRLLPACAMRVAVCLQLR